MAIRKRYLPKLNLQPVKELVDVRRMQHGGSPGAPPVKDGSREGAALNKSCVMMLSAVLQAHIEDVFLVVSRRLFKTLKGDDVIERYTNSYYRWGNPDANNIRNLFRRLGIDNVFEGLSWQKATTENIKEKLVKINETRNRIAHGKDSDPALTLSMIDNWCNFVDNFGSRFAAHVMTKVKRP